MEVGCGRHVLGGLANLPVAVLQRCCDRRVDRGSAERGQRQDRPTAHGGLVGATGEDGGQPALVADGPQRCDRRFAHQRVVVRGGQLHERFDGRDRDLFATGPRRRLDDGGLGVGEQRQQVELRPLGRERDRTATNARMRVVARGDDVVVGEASHTAERTERQLARHRVGVAEGRARGRFVGGVPGDREVAPAMLGGHCFSMFVRVMTSHDMPNPTMVAMMAPTHTANPRPDAAAHTRRAREGGATMGVSTSARGTASATAPRALRGLLDPRAGSALALAGLRQPVATSATMASPAIQPAAMVTSVTFTQSDMVTEPAPSVRAPSRRHRWWAIPLAFVALVAAATPLVLSFVPSTVFIDKSRCAEYDTTVSPPVCTRRVTEPVEFALVPAAAQPVGPRLSIKGASTYPSSDQVYFVTITQPDITLFDWWIIRDSDAVRFMSYHDKYGDESPDQMLQSGQRQMRTAKDNARYVALKVAGYPVELQAGEVIIDFLLCLEVNEAGTKCTKYSPADELLDPGDVITKVDGKPVDTIEDLGPILKGIEPGAKVDVEFTRAGTPMKGQVATIVAPGEDPPRTIIGFRPIDTTTVKMPEGIDIGLDTDRIGGPSAGLAFTLQIIDQLTKGNLLGGQRIAVTGTIELDGTVGAIGGLAAKASAVAQTGVKYFIVPSAQGEDGADGLAQARKAVGNDVTIIPVATIDEALAALVRLGGDPIVPNTTT